MVVMIAPSSWLAAGKMAAVRYRSISSIGNHVTVVTYQRDVASR
jgi:hypothetical protein